MASKLEIWNMALDLLDEEPATTTEDTRAAARWMKRNYNAIRDALLRVHPWNFALTRVKLPAAANAPAFGWTRQFALPTDCLRVLPLTEGGAPNGQPLSFEIEDGKILTNAAAPLAVRYVKRAAEGRFDPLFVAALATALAHRASHFITGKSGLRSALEAEASRALRTAQIADSLEGTPSDPIDEAWQIARGDPDDES